MEQETKKCKYCGRELPISNFKRTRWGSHTSVCIECDTKHRKETKLAKQKVIDEFKLKKELADFTARQLMQELARRGYKGQLTFTRTETIDITNF